MLASLLHLFAQAASFALVIGLGVAGLLLLPWTDDEVRATESALHTTWRIARHAPALAAQGARSAALAVARGATVVERFALPPTRP